MSPTILQSGRYRLFFFTNESSEPPHVHVRRDDRSVKFWLNPVREAYNDGFRAVELSRIAAIVRDNEAALAKAWDDYFQRSNGHAGGSARSRD